MRHHHTLGAGTSTDLKQKHHKYHRTSDFTAITATHALWS